MAKTKQTVKVFCYGKYLDEPLITETIEEQMNRYLEEHPGHRFTSVSSHIAHQYKEAIAIIDTGEPVETLKGGK